MRSASVKLMLRRLQVCVQAQMTSRRYGHVRTPCSGIASRCHVVRPALTVKIAGQPIAPIRSLHTSTNLQMHIQRLRASYPAVSTFLNVHPAVTPMYF